MNSNHYDLKKYYQEIYPCEAIFRWLSINGNREMSFCIDDNKYIRYLSFKNHEEFKERLVSIVPKKIDIGAEFDVTPDRSINMKVVRKELIFDVDLTDYERNCCRDKTVCENCFVIIKIAVEILNYSLRNEFGFEKLAFIFSGRRGVHCWVTDDVAQYTYRSPKR